MSSLLDAYEVSLGDETVPFARSLKDVGARTLPAGINFMDFVDENGDVDILAFREALVNLLEAQQATASTTTSATSTTTSATTTTSTTTTTTTTTTTVAPTTVAPTTIKQLRVNAPKVLGSANALSMADIIAQLSANAGSMTDSSLRLAQGEF